MGEEPYFIDRIEKKLYQTVLTEEERPFNQTILYGKDTTVNQILDAAKRFPMMAEFQLVIVREAQELWCNRSIGGLHRKPTACNDTRTVL